MPEREHEYHAALASRTRREVLDALREAPGAIDAAVVAERLGLHVTTARFHLDQLVAAGLAARQAGAERRRGRPRVLYAPAGEVRDDDARDALIEALATALVREPDGVEAAVGAGRRWAAGFPAASADAASGDPASAAAPALMAALGRLGFEPELDDAGDRIRLLACPFRDAARAHPDIVCAVHRGLVEELAAPAAGTARLVPFVEPRLCVVELEGRASA